MSDVHSKKVRSYNMSQIKSKDTKPEILVRSFLFKNRFRYRLHVKSLPGKPDIVLKSLKTVVFVDGCFWHGHRNCKYNVLPKTRTEWWLNKINKNKENDAIKRKELKLQEWNVVSIWECELKHDKREKTLSRLFKALQEIKK